MEIGSRLVDFNLKGTDGKMYNKYTYADRSALLIIITCNHCPYSRAYWNRIRNLYSRYEEDNLGILTVNSNDAKQYPEDSYENMITLAKGLGNTFVYLHDESQDLAKALGAKRTPEAFLFNSKRELIYKGAIDDSWENEHMVTRVYLEDALEHALDGLEVDYPEIEAVGCTIKWKVGNEPSI